jgi:DNA replication factor GINS
MYDTLYSAWKKEKQNTELQKLPENFYTSSVEYIDRTKQEGRMLDPKSVKAKLIARELSTTKRLMTEIVELRFKKIVQATTAEKPLKTGAATPEEERIIQGIVSSVEEFNRFLRTSIQGKLYESKPRRGRLRSRVLLRFLNEVPAIAGADLKIYGPFSPEDVATLPADNAKTFIKRGIAVEIEPKEDLAKGQS